MVRFSGISILLFAFLCSSCGQSKSNNQVNSNTINKQGATIEERFLPPDGYKRIDTESESFDAWLRKLPLKPDGTNALLFDGREKPASGVYCAVVDLPIGTKNLHQCADAIIRLRAEYLWESKLYSEIHFNFTSGFRADYSKWMSGKRVAVNGNNCSWVSKTAASNTHDDLWNYLETVFMYAGTLSLEKGLVKTDWESMQIGDVLIRGGSPGHAVIVVDMAVDETSGEKVFMLAQSYMPAQEIQILINPNNSDLSPWYSLNCDNDIQTPEWGFVKANLKRFE
ncbi:MAG: hypothetical protein CVU11_08155 [Bacteroidetes bacterium HGW-Bacteroidetes-6]|jgi:hypothetical protein|nr:MAG: hypothetical protein CVU11_08155 [Bacteroidetes bacterium HGW-Bacteroidetes-6]